MPRAKKVVMVAGLVITVVVLVLLESGERAPPRLSAAKREEGDKAEGGKLVETAVDDEGMQLDAMLQVVAAGAHQNGGCGNESQSQAQAPPNTCGSNTPAARGCSHCTTALPGSFSFEDGFGLDEFTHGSRAISRNWLPILKDLDDSLTSVVRNARRHVIDIGYTGPEELEWITGLYSSNPSTSYAVFEPNPRTLATLRATASEQSITSRLPMSFHNLGIGAKDGQQLFWFNKEAAQSSFQRVRGDDYEQVPIFANVSRLDSIYRELPGTVVPFMKVSAGRWEHAALTGARRVLNRTAVVVADISSVPNNSAVVQFFSQHGFVVYALGCGSLARIPQDRPWWWSPVLAVKPALKHVADSYTCWDFSKTGLVCDSPKAAKYAPEGCRDALSKPLSDLKLSSDMDPVETTAMSSPETHRKLKIVFLMIILYTVCIAAYYLGLPLVMVVIRSRSRE